LATKNSTTTILISHFSVGTWPMSNWRATPVSWSVLPISASPPPTAIMQAEAKKAVPSRNVVRMALSKMRGLRVMNCRIHSRRWAFISTVTEGWPAGGCSVIQPMPNQASSSQLRAARSAADSAPARGAVKAVFGSMARF